MLRRSVAIAGLAFAAHGCNFDWTVRHVLAEAGAGGVAGSGGAGGVEAGPDCTDLAAALTSARDAARACQLAQGQCAATATDECGCKLFVALSASPQTQSYEQAVSEYLAAGCTPACAPQCPILPVQGGCVLLGSVQSCSP